MTTRSGLRLGLWTAAAVLLSLSASVEVASACSCMSSGPPCQAVWRADAVFAGSVVSVDTIVDDSSKERPQWTMRRVRVKVTEAFRNVSAAEVDLFTGTGGGDCGYDFVAGRDYLIYAYGRPTDGRLYANICSRTRPITEAGEDLRYLRGPAKQSATGLGRVFGVVRRVDPDVEGRLTEQPPLEGVPVTARADGRAYRAVTRADGSYQMSVLAGSYQVTVQLPDELYHYGALTAEVRDLRGCAEADFYTHWNGRVAGRVLNAAGDPVPGLAVELLPLRSLKEASFSPSHESRTGADGRYEIAQVPPGVYHLGTDTWRSGPRGRDRQPGPEGLNLLLKDETSAPRTMEVGRGNRIEAADFVLPERLALVEVSGIVLGTNGAPAAGVQVYVRTDSEEYSDLPPPIVTKQDGRFAMTVIAGRRYRISAEGYEKGRYAFRAERRGIESSESVKGLVLELKPLK